MIRALMQKLGLDRIGDLVADEVGQVQIDVLREEREVVARMIAKLDERIAGLGGKRRGRSPKASHAAATAAPATRKPRPKNGIPRKPGESLKDFVLRAFEKAKGPLNPTDLAALVKRLGYQTAADPKNFLITIYHVLADTKVFRRMGKGVFGLKVEQAGRTRTKRAARRSGGGKTTRRARSGRRRGAG